MNEIDGSELDGQLLRVFLTVLETASVTRAAERLGLTQSAVSHALQRLTRIVGAPLFVKSGRGIVATGHAADLAPRARDLLQAMREFASRGAFTLADTRFDLTIAANDLQRDLLLPPLYQRMSEAAASARLRVIPSETPSVDLLRRNVCDLLITPLPPDASDIVQRKLFVDSYVCFVDAAVRTAPRSAAEYLSARHATVIYPDDGRLQFDKDLEQAGVKRRIVVAAPSFAGVSAFLRGSDLVATLPAGLSHHLLRGFATSRIPVKLPIRAQLGLLTMYLAWHRRRHDDAALGWVRSQLVDIGRRMPDGSDRGRLVSVR